MALSDWGKYLPWTAMFLLACGGERPEAGATDAGAPNVADVAMEGYAAPDGCVSPSGYAICGGPRDCFPPADRGQQTKCWDCAQNLVPDAYQMSICDNAAHPDTTSGGYATDGQIYVESGIPNDWIPFPFDVGQLFAENDAGDRVRYADWSSWTGQTLPQPSKCPQFAGFSICGGLCGPCGAGQMCTGRSPLHPYGLCATTDNPGCNAGGNWACPSGQACAVYKDPAADQPTADRWAGLCFPMSACQAIASSYPGGAACHP